MSFSVSSHAPNPMAPGFPRSWPDCHAAMTSVARHLLAHGAEDEEVMICLMMDFPALPDVAGPRWRSDAYVANVTALERMHLLKHPDLAAAWRDEPSAYELQVVGSAGELVRLCRRYDLHIALSHIAGDLATSRKVMVGGPVFHAIKQYKGELIRLLSRAS